MSLVSGKYKMIILYWLAEYSVLRYNELKRRLGTISHKTLSLSLKEPRNSAPGYIRQQRSLFRVLRLRTIHHRQHQLRGGDGSPAPGSTPSCSTGPPWPGCRRYR